MSIVDISIQFFRDTLMVRKLLAIIRRDRMGSDRQRLHELNNSIRHGMSGLALYLSQEGSAALSSTGHLRSLPACGPSTINPPAR